MSANFSVGLSQPVLTARELKAPDKDNRLVFTQPVADLIHGRIVAKWGFAMTKDDAGKNMMLDLSAAWQELPNMGKLLKRARSIVPAGLDLTYNRGSLGVAVQLHEEDAVAYGVDYSCYQPFDEHGMPKGPLVEGVICLTLDAFGQALVDAKAIPALSDPNMSAKPLAEAGINVANIVESVKHVRAHGPVAHQTQRNGKPVTLYGFPKGTQRDTAMARIAEERAKALAANNRLAAFAGVE